MIAQERHFRAALGALLRHHRLALEVSQAEIAREVGISQAGLGNYERGRRTPSAWVLVRLADALFVRPEGLQRRAVARATELALREQHGSPPPPGGGSGPVEGLRASRLERPSEAPAAGRSVARGAA